MAADRQLIRLKALFEGVLAPLEGVEAKRLFGCDGYFVQGRLFALVWKEGRLGLRFSEEALRSELLSEPGAAAWDPGSGAVKRWVLLPEAWHRQPAKLKPWARLAWEQAAKQAAKGPRAVRPKAVRAAVFPRLRRDGKET